MSYILDALNKSEQERQTKQSPSINSQYRVPLKSNNTSKYRIVLLVMLVMINIAGLVFWITQSQKAPAIEKTSSIENASILENDPQQEIRSTQTVANTIETDIPLQKISIFDLSKEVQSQLPDLRFSTHLYGEDKSFRMVNINGVMLKEGEDITEDLLLNEITEEGIIIHYQNYLIEIGILSNWRAN